MVTEKPSFGYLSYTILILTSQDLFLKNILTKSINDDRMMTILNIYLVANGLDYCELTNHRPMLNSLWGIVVTTRGE